VRRVEVGGKPGRQLHCRGLTLLQVALHTGRQVAGSSLVRRVLLGDRVHANC
jgi:hypothetical protein